MDGASIVVATDLSDDSGCAAVWANSFARRYDLAVVVTHVVSISVSNWASGAYDVLDKPGMMDKAERKVRRWYTDMTGDEPDDVRVAVGHTPVQLCKVAREMSPSMMALAVSGKGSLEKFFVGSTAQSVANDPPCPVVVVDSEHAVLPEISRLVVGVDFSNHGSRVLEFAAKFARIVGGTLDIVHADTTPTFAVVDQEDLPEKFVSNGHYQWAQNEMNTLIDAHRDILEGIEYDTHVIDKPPAEGLLEFVRQVDAALVVVGRSGHTRFISSVMGSVVSKTMQSFAATTIIVPTGDATHQDSSRQDG